MSKLDEPTAARIGAGYRRTSSSRRISDNESGVRRRSTNKHRSMSPAAAAARSSSSRSDTLTSGGNMTHALNASRRRKHRLLNKLRRRHMQLMDADEPCKETLDKLVATFRALAISDGGLLSDNHREHIWRLFACDFKQFAVDEERVTPSNQWSDTSSMSESSCSTSMLDYDSMPLSSASFLDKIELLKEHREWRQVEMDVHRTLTRFPPNIDEERRVELQAILIPLVVSVLMEDDKYNYYQGFHDVCLTLLLAMDSPQSAQEAASCLAQHGLFRRFLKEPLELCAPMYAHLIYVILRQTDPELEAWLRKAELGHMFCLSWLLTWFAHSIDDYRIVVRLYDLFLASHFLMPVYFAAALLLFRASEIMERCDCDMPSVHSLLTRSWPIHFPLEALVNDAHDLFMQYPPSLLRGTLLARYDVEVTKGRPIVIRQPESLREILAGQIGAGTVMLGAQSGSLRHSALSATVCAVTASAAAWYVYNRLGGMQSLSWMALF